MQAERLEDKAVTCQEKSNVRGKVGRSRDAWKSKSAMQGQSKHGHCCSGDSTNGRKNDARKRGKGASLLHELLRCETCGNADCRVPWP